MDDARRVRAREPLSDLRDDAMNVARFEAAFAMESRLEVLSGEPFHGEEGDPLEDVEVEDAHHVGAVELRHGARLAFEAHTVVWVAFGPRGRELDGATHAERLVVGKPHCAHAAAPQLANEPEPAGDESSGGGIHGAWTASHSPAVPTDGIRR